MATGKIKFFNLDKGFGFVTDDAGKDFFFHYSYIFHDPQEVKAGDIVVSFEVVPSEQPGYGPTARHICIAGRQVVEMEEAPPIQSRKAPTPPTKPPSTAAKFTPISAKGDAQYLWAETLVVKFMAAALVGLTVDWDDEGQSPAQVADLAYQVARAAIKRLEEAQEPPK